MKKCEFYFEGFAGNGDAIERVCSWLRDGRLPHALLITAPNGCGRNAFARALAAAYLDDEAGRVARAIHPDCLVVEGEGASGNIPVARIRTLAYELHRAPVMADGRRVALLRDVKNLNANSANALLKILEEPPAGVVFVLTAQTVGDILDTLRSRCVMLPLQPLEPDFCTAAIAASMPNYPRERIAALCRHYGGRMGLVLRALGSSERLALCDAAARVCMGALSRDKLAVLTELQIAETREQFAALLEDTALYLTAELEANPACAEQAGRLSQALFSAQKALGRYTPVKLVAAGFTAQL